mmetsp:Transcript_7376/g.18045  ORF Transcript_7376/g.18045 Transcript_7376/m.18045 type:complete len:112 (-) Transcript_7376:857-1192(-)
MVAKSIKVCNSVEVLFLSAVTSELFAEIRCSVAPWGYLAFAVNKLDHRALFESEIPFLFDFHVQFVLKIFFAGISPNFCSPLQVFSLNSCLSALPYFSHDEKQYPRSLPYY